MARWTSSSNSNAEKKTWTSLWKTQVPSKIKIFLWRLAQQSRPSADLLHHRNMSTTSTRGICGSEDSWQHSLLHCHMARCVWALEDPNLVEAMESSRELGAKMWLFALIDLMILSKLWSPYGLCGMHTGKHFTNISFPRPIQRTTL